MFVLTIMILRQITARVQEKVWIRMRVSRTMSTRVATLHDPSALTLNDIVNWSRMMKFVTICLALAFTGVASAADFVPLFNGKSLDGWTERQVRKGQEGRWSVEDGILKAKPGSGWLGTEKTYGDYVLRVEWKIVENGNSGVF